MNITECKRFAYCNANICPLDKDMFKRTYLKGEPVCPYLGEYSKPHARANMKGAIARKLYEAIDEAYPKVLSEYAPLKKALNRAAKTPSRLTSLRASHSNG